MRVRGTDEGVPLSTQPVSFSYFSTFILNCAIKLQMVVESQ